MKHKLLYFVVLLSLFFMVLISLGGGFWGAEKSIGHWTGNMFRGVCHQIPARSFTMNGVQMAVNARCFGIFVGLLSGWILIPAAVCIINKKNRVLWFLFLAVVVQIIDYSGNLLQFWENSNLSRAVLGWLLGMAVSIAVFDQFQTDN